MYTRTNATVMCTTVLVYRSRAAVGGETGSISLGILWATAPACINVSAMEVLSAIACDIMAGQSRKWKTADDN